MIYIDRHILPGFRHEEIEEKIKGITGEQAKTGSSRPFREMARAEGSFQMD